VYGGQKKHGRKSDHSLYVERFLRDRTPFRSASQITDHVWKGKKKRAGRGLKCNCVSVNITQLLSGEAILTSKDLICKRRQREKTGRQAGRD